MSDAKSYRLTLKEFDNELRKSRRESIRALSMALGVLYRGEFTFASIEMSKGALSLLGKKLSDIGTALAFRAELMALEKGKTSINKKTMKAILDELEEAAKEEYGSQNSVGKGWPSATIPQQEVKSVTNLKGKDFQTNGTQRDPPPYQVVKKEAKEEEDVKGQNESYFMSKANRKAEEAES